MTPSPAPGTTSLDDDYGAFLAAVRARFAAAIEPRDARLFTTGTPDLYETYLGAIPSADRKWHTCSVCRAFFRNFAGLATIDDKGRTRSVLWDRDRVPAFYREVAGALCAAVEKAPVDGVFLYAGEHLGKAEAGGHPHFAVDLPAERRWTSVVTTASQAMAAKREEREMLLRGLGEFPLEAVRMAHGYLTNGSLSRSEKHEGVAKWLLGLHEMRGSTKKERQEHLLWQAVAAAPPGWCHVRSGMIGTLLQDIVANLPFAEIKRRFDAKMDPLEYLRPKAAPTQGNLAQAERIVAQLKSAGSLERRFARLSDVVTLWTPRDAKGEQATEGKVFAHLAPKGRASDAVRSEAPPVVMTWVKFEKKVLPEAEAIELRVATQAGNYGAIVTAARPESPPILQWDTPERRNTASWYVYHGGSLPSRWGIEAGKLHRIRALVLQPTLWDASRSLDHHGAGVMLVVEGARDVDYKSGGGMFPESMRSEYHPVRKTLEAHFTQAVIAGKDEAEVCGLILNKGGTFGAELQVRSAGVWTAYTLDRWD